jgi:hypothetical protein
MRRAAYAFILPFALISGALTIALVKPIASRPVVGSDISDLSFRPHPGAWLPLTAPLVDESGRAVKLGDYFSKSPVSLVLE